MYMYSDTNTMSSHNVIHSQPSPPLSSPPPREEQLSIDEISSPISARILELCDSELFPEALQNSECSSSNCCFEENSSSSYATTLDIVENNKLNRNSNTTTTNNNNIIFKSQEEDEIIENDISASIDFSVPSSSLQFDFSLVQSAPLPPPPQVSVSVVNNNNNGIMPHYVPPPMNPSSLSCVFEEEECLVGSYMPMNPSSSNCTYLGPPGIGGPYMPPPPPPPPGIYGGRTILLGSELQPQDMEFQGENGTGIYCPDSIQRVFNTPDLQALGTENQQVLGVGGSNSTTLTQEISNLEDSTFKVGKLSVEQRKEKIDRYMKKRNERNFNKKIKYACRKTLADSRPRVRGRFAKNDEFGENHRPASSNHEEEDEEVVVKEEDDMVDSSDIFAYISGVNSFKCNQSIQSWI